MSDHGSGHHELDYGPGDLEKALASIFAGLIISAARLAKSFMISIFNFLLRFLHRL